MTAVSRIKITNRQSIIVSTVGSVMVRATGLEPARFWQWNLNPPSLPIPPYPRMDAGEIIGVFYSITAGRFLSTGTVAPGFCQMLRRVFAKAGKIVRQIILHSVTFYLSATVFSRIRFDLKVLIFIVFKRNI